MFQFREDEIHHKPKIVQSIVNHAVGVSSNKIHARKCQINKVSFIEAQEFLNQNHLMGFTNATYIGLYYENKLVSLIGFKQRRNVLKIERFCSQVNSSIMGGFSKLLKHIEEHYLNAGVDEIHNWVDLRYGTGEHLLNKGFEFSRDVLGWKWTDFKQTYNRLKCRANMDERRLTQKLHAEELGWHKIYDAGQRLFVRNL